MLDATAIDRILERYPHASAFQRWHMRGRLKLCPYEKLDRHLTGADTLLDVGCGFGHFAWHLAAVKPEMRYHGTDIDARKIALAQACLTVGGAAPPQFHLGDASTLPDLPEAFGNIVFLDVLYLLPWEAQKGLMAWALRRLAPGPESVMVIKTMEQARGFSGFRAVAEEWIMVVLMRRTMSSGALNGARPASDYLEFARGLGFQGEVEDLGTFNPSTVMRFHR
ncbi:MAG: class I SAM-dependent methyltransferase [Fibrobacteria bacterium]